MKKIGILIVSILLVFAIPLIGLPVYAVTTPDVYGNTYLAAMADKYERLHAISEKKIILVGGSGTAFGVDSALLEKELGMPVVNMGLYAALGSKTTLDLTRSGIKKGDIVVFAPEPDEQTYSLYTDAQIQLQVLESNRAMVRQIPVKEWAALWNGLPDYITACKRLAADIPAPVNAYSRSAFNEYGDNAYARPYNVMPDLYSSENKIDISEKLFNSDFIRYVNEYADKVKKKGASFWFSFPPMNRLALGEAATYEMRVKVYNELKKALHCEIIGNIEDHIMHEGYFYDSNYHLNDSGVPYNTKLLAGDIKRQKGDTSATDITVLPPSGASNEDLPAEDDETYSEDFLYEEDTAGWAVTAVAEGAKEKGTLTVPRAYRGKPVYKIKRDAFAGCRAVSIFIGDTVTVFEDGAFAGCTDLTTVNLSVKRGASDNLPTVGDDLFAGANARLKVYVPPEKYGGMLTDYFWMRYADRLAIAR